MVNQRTQTMKAIKMANTWILQFVNEHTNKNLRIPAIDTQKVYNLATCRPQIMWSMIARQKRKELKELRRSKPPKPSPKPTIEGPPIQY